MTETIDDGRPICPNCHEPFGEPGAPFFLCPKCGCGNRADDDEDAFDDDDDSDDEFGESYPKPPAGPVTF